MTVCSFLVLKDKTSLILRGGGYVRTGESVVVENEAFQAEQLSQFRRQGPCNSLIRGNTHTCRKEFEPCLAACIQHCTSRIEYLRVGAKGAQGNCAQNYEHHDTYRIGKHTRSRYMLASESVPSVSTAVRQLSQDGARCFVFH